MDPGTNFGTTPPITGNNGGSDGAEAVANLDEDGTLLQVTIDE